MEKIILVTGATSGFGKAIAEKFAENKFNVIITGRRTELLQSLKEELQIKYGVKVLALNFDVRDKNAVKEQLGQLPQEWSDIDILVNNAGLAVGAVPIQDGLIDDWERMIDTNIKGLLYVTRTIAPMMIENGHGHIFNMGSVAGKWTYTNGNVYCATKYAVNSLTQAMRMDMLPYGIKVTQIAPGAAETEFSLVRYKGDKAAADNVYKGFQPLVAADIADIVYYCATLPKHVNINDLVVCPTAQADPNHFYKK